MRKKTAKPVVVWNEQEKVVPVSKATGTRVFLYPEDPGDNSYVATLVHPRETTFWGEVHLHDSTKNTVELDIVLSSDRKEWDLEARRQLCALMAARDAIDSIVKAANKWLDQQEALQSTLMAQPRPKKEKVVEEEAPVEEFSDEIEEEEE